MISLASVLRARVKQMGYFYSSRKQKVEMKIYFDVKSASFASKRGVKESRCLFHPIIINMMHQHDFPQAPFYYLHRMEIQTIYVVIF
jgi:hypothetical protein